MLQARGEKYVHDAHDDDPAAASAQMCDLWTQPHPQLEIIYYESVLYTRVTVMKAADNKLRSGRARMLRLLASVHGNLSGGASIDATMCHGRR